MCPHSDGFGLSGIPAHIPMLPNVDVNGLSEVTGFVKLACLDQICPEVGGAIRVNCIYDSKSFLV